ncbi:MAG: hypothetical protein JXA81_14920 [Sedimentisphaerales bacterium]|nr:hypothetical protein [Sedimentisphaerales bacterium]
MPRIGAYHNRLAGTAGDRQTIHSEVGAGHHKQVTKSNIFAPLLRAPTRARARGDANGKKFPAEQGKYIGYGKPD